MDRTITRASIDPSVIRFAERLRAELDAKHVLLFGSQAYGNARPDSDYDLIIVADSFRTVSRFRRTIGLHDLFYEAGGHAPLDLICLSPEEFEYARTHITLVHAVLPEAIELLPDVAPAG